MSIPFTQFLMPNGRKNLVTIDRPDKVEKQAEALIAANLSLEIEMLTTGEISMTVEDHSEENTVAIRVCHNGPDVPINVDDMIDEAWNIICNKEPSNDPV